MASFSLPTLPVSRSSASLLFLALTWFPLSASAQLYWDTNTTGTGSGNAGGAWDTSTSNWSTDSTGLSATTTWSNGNLAIFSAGTDGTGTLAITASGSLNPAGITIEEGTVNFTGGTLDLGGDTITVGSALTSNMSSTISGAGILTKAGAGTFVVTGTNTFTGTISVDAGILKATTSTTALGTGTANLNLNGGTLALANDASLNLGRNTTVSQNSTVTLGRLTAGNGGQTFTLGTLSIGASTLTVNADTTTLNVNNNAATTVTFGATTLTDTATFNVVNATATNALTTVTLGAVTDGASTFGINKTGTGRLTLSAANTIDGKTTVTGGLVSMAAEDRLGSNPGTFTADQLLLNGGGIEASASFAIDDSGRGITLGTNGGTFDVDNSFTLTVATPNVITGAGNLTKSDAGTLVLGLNNTYTGTTIVAGGTLRIDQNITSGGGPGQLGNSSAAIQVGGTATSASLLTSGAYTIARDIQIRGGGSSSTLGTSATTGTTVFQGNITNNNASNSQQLLLQAAGTSTVEFKGNIAGNTSLDWDGDSSVSKTGTGTVVLEGNNTYRGYTQIGQGTVVAKSNNALGTGTGSFGTGVVTGATLELQNNITTPETIVLNGTGVSNAGALKSSSGNNTVSGPVSLGSASTINSATAGNTLTMAGNVRADYALTVTGAGNTVISGVLSGSTGYVAGLSEGKLAGGLGFDTTNANPGGAQVLTPVAGNNGARNAAGKWGDFETWVYTGQIYDADGIFTFAESIDDAVRVTIDGVIRLQNGSWDVITNTGNKDGERNAGATVGVPVTGANTGTPLANLGMGLNNDGWHTIEIRFGNGSGGLGAVGYAAKNWTSTHGFGYSIDGSVGFDGAVFITPTDDGSGTFFRTQVSNSLSKTGTGTLTLSNANTYEGGTSISEGTLLVTNVTGSGTGTGTVAVQSGGTLGGTGIVGGSTNIMVGGKLAIGADNAAVTTDFGIESLNFNSNLTISGTATFDIASASSFDKLIVDGLFSLNADSIIQVNLGSFTPLGNEVFDLIDWGTVSMTGFNASSLSDLVLPSLGAGFIWDTSRFTSQGIIAIVTPEPARGLLCILSLGVLLFRRRR